MCSYFDEWCVCVAAMEPASEAVIDTASHSSLMEADDFQLRAVESDESL